MQHVLRILVKFVVSLVALGIILGMFYNFSFGDVFLITAVLGVVSYFVGDLLILRATNNTIATAGDFVLTFLIVWLMGQYLTYEKNLFSAALISAAAVAGFEYFFHKFLTVKDPKQMTTTLQNRPHYQTEASEELAPVKPDVRSSDERES